MLGSMIFVPFMCKKLGLEKLIRYSLLIGGAICVALFGLHLVMEVPPLVHGVILGVGTGFAMVSIQMQWGLVGEAIDYNDLSPASAPKAPSTAPLTCPAASARLLVWASASSLWTGSAMCRN